MPFSQKHLLIKENTFCKFAYFIEKGMTRSFWLVNGEEITTSFSCEGGIVFSMDELYYNKLSEEFVETLEDVVAYKISLADLNRLFKPISNWLTGDGLSIKMNIDVCSVHIRNGLHCRPKNVTKSLSSSFLKCASGLIWDISYHIWGSSFLHLVVSGPKNNFYTIIFCHRTNFMFFKLRNFAALLCNR